jgi:hypothetical protein
VAKKGNSWLIGVLGCLLVAALIGGGIWAAQSGGRATKGASGSETTNDGPSKTPQVAANQALPKPKEPPAQPAPQPAPPVEPAPPTENPAASPPKEPPKDPVEPKDPVKPPVEPGPAPVDPPSPPPGPPKPEPAADVDLPQIEKSLSAAQTRDEFQRVAQQAVEAAGQLVAQSKADDARKAAILGLSAARKAKDTDLVKQATLLLLGKRRAAPVESPRGQMELPRGSEETPPAPRNPGTDR